MSETSTQAALDGVSVVICCHNSAEKLPAVFDHLKKLDPQPDFDWEIVLIDNCCSDATVSTALDLWTRETGIPLRIIQESKLGAGYARVRGLEEAGYDVVAFVDDDVWVAPDWLARVWQLMRDQPSIGACGGYNEPVCESTPPFWFRAYSRHYAVGAQADVSGDITDKKGYIFGAGMCVRKKAWLKALERTRKDRDWCAGRLGQKIPGAGEDEEICYMVRLAGYQIWYDDRLKVKHFLPAKRLTENYLKNLYYGFGRARIYLAPYLSVMERRRFRFLKPLHEYWFSKSIFIALKLLTSYWGILVSKITGAGFPNASLNLSWNQGRWKAMRHLSYRYTERIGRLRQLLA